MKHKFPSYHQQTLDKSFLIHPDKINQGWKIIFLLSSDLLIKFLNNRFIVVLRERGKITIIFSQSSR